MFNRIAVKKISGLQPYERYTFSIKRIADFEEAWLLKNLNGDIAIAEIDGHIVTPIWPASEFTISCQVGIWEKYIASKVDLEQIEDEVLSLVSTEGYLIDMFPVDDKSGFVVTVEEFLRDLNIELKRIIRT